MAKLLTPIESGSATATAGERRFAERLKDLLEDDYLCWFNVPVGTLRQYPDFVLLHPSRGLWVFEVKDWRVEIIKNVDKHKFEIHTGDAIKSVANPLEQARQYCMTISTAWAPILSSAILPDPTRGKFASPMPMRWFSAISPENSSMKY